MKKFHLKKMYVISILAAGLFTGCEKSADSFSLLSDSAQFKQSNNYVQRKIDILWVIDNSHSMATSQQNLAIHFQSFINRFNQLNYDFHMAVTTTDAYMHNHFNDPQRSIYKDGNLHGTTGWPIMSSVTPDLNNVFMQTILQGTTGSGDERAFSSFQTALNNELNSGFLREGAFLSIIIVSDEDDFSHDDHHDGLNSYYYTEDYNHPEIIPIATYKNFLNQITQTKIGEPLNYSVSSIQILDHDCLNELNNEWTGRKIGHRYQSLVQETEGILGSLCANFADTLSKISNNVLELSSRFKLDREPYEESLVITINNILIPKNTNNGWSYDKASQSIIFHGSAIPPAGADVKIYFDPVSVKL